ncbi:MAG TPA: hypothetical protein PK373_07050, partial [Sedimentisphaerales bacterium]|nr:hypothetical protein [Sedimentisphaerales bacterium]
ILPYLPEFIFGLVAIGILVAVIAAAVLYVIASGKKGSASPADLPPTDTRSIRLADTRWWRPWWLRRS